MIFTESSTATAAAAASATKSPAASEASQATAQGAAVNMQGILSFLVLSWVSEMRNHDFCLPACRCATSEVESRQKQGAAAELVNSGRGLRGWSNRSRAFVKTGGDFLIKSEQKVAPTLFSSAERLRHGGCQRHEVSCELPVAQTARFS